MTEVQPKIKQQRKKRNVTNGELTSWDYNPPTFFYERLRPMSEKAIENFCREMIAWATQDTSLVFSRFFSERKPPMVMSDLYEMCKKNTMLDEAVKLTKQMLAGRREEGGINWKYNFNAIRETQPLYDPEYKIWKLEAIKSTADHIEKIVVLPAIPTPKDDTHDIKG